jgi:hypothetical protein
MALTLIFTNPFHIVMKTESQETGEALLVKSIWKPANRYTKTNIIVKTIELYLGIWQTNQPPEKQAA